MFYTIYITMLVLPLVGIFIILFLNKVNKNVIKNIGFIISIIIFISSVFLIVNFDKSTIKLQYLTNTTWIKDTYQPLFYEFAVDGISIFFVLLTTFIFPLCYISAWSLINKFDLFNLKFFIINLLILEFFLLNAFLTTNLLLFFFFFESVLIPMFFIIGCWGPGDRRKKANYYFVFYTIAGSALLLFSILVIFIDMGTLSYIYIFEPTHDSFSLSKKLQIILWLFFFFFFFLKVPIFLFLIWLPEAHVEAPTVGSVILAALLLKLGGYGFIRFLPLFVYAYNYYMPLVFSLALLSLVYASLSAIRQIDLKKIIAYSSIAHMNLSILGVFSLTYQGIQGSLFLLISHGLVSSALFFLVGMLYDRYHTKLLKYYGGLVIKMPIFSIYFFFFSVSNLAFPGTSNFISELLVLVGLAEKNLTIAIFAATGMLFSSIYSIWLFNRLVFGNVKLTFIDNYQDLTQREFILLLPLVFFTLLLGLIPDIILEISYCSIKGLITFI